MTKKEAPFDRGNLMKMRDMVYACTRCGYCREKYSSDMTKTPAFRVCPVREHSGGFEHHCARGKLLIAQGLLEGRVGYSQELVELFYSEPDCRLCTWVCNTMPLIDPPQVWRAIRQDLVEAGLGPPEPIRKIDDRVRKSHNTFGAKTSRSKWAEGLDLPLRSELLYFAGCYSSYSQTETARATIAVLRHAGENPAFLGDSEWCCGVSQFHDGSILLAKQMAEHNIEMIISSGAKTVVTGCAECYKSLKLEYPALVGHLPFEVLHTSEIFAGMLAEERICFDVEPTEKKLTYHDPCSLGRYLNVFEPPRSIISSIPGVELLEMQRHHDYAWCCGYGADMVNSVQPEVASDIAAGRMAEAKEAGAEAVVTACPRCVRALSKAGRGMKVYDLTVLVAMSMGLLGMKNRGNSNDVWF
ncbi:putative CoB--CoM heterodisulfide reductase iron-sulfur subunit D [uncultured Desulfobacterium sp.]|uniref:Putative CoB--CoM heterodisulfide reductase iron-sulfur subunit D n=1 Tax=uncultured Desulfobacterium sp. TaxID=201089 RepID=A0A445MY84_9BACT|nr:putative CoB--CoM heterodisulfide reductase iron-sulfur subunit D [uncultured Desulfobacterium sp.]